VHAPQAEDYLIDRQFDTSPASSRGEAGVPTLPERPLGT
jgi:hypothetical protein